MTDERRTAPRRLRPQRGKTLPWRLRAFGLKTRLRPFTWESQLCELKAISDAFVELPLLTGRNRQPG